MSTSSNRGNETLPTPDNAGDSSADMGGASVPGTGKAPGEGTGDGSEGPSTSGTDAAGAAGAAGGSADAAPPVRARKKRGPNKPKPGTFTVETKAVLRQDQIFNLLTAHAVTQLGADVAGRMTLQVVSVEGVCRPLADELPPGATLQFATIRADE